MFCLTKANIKPGTGGFKMPVVGELSKMPKRHVGTGATESRAKEGNGLENVGGQEKKTCTKEEKVDGDGSLGFCFCFFFWQSYRSLGGRIYVCMVCKGV